MISTNSIFESAHGLEIPNFIQIVAGPYSCPCHRFVLLFGPYKEIHALLGFRISLFGFQFPLFGLRIPDRLLIPDSRKLAQDKNSGFQRCLDSGYLDYLTWDDTVISTQIYIY
jgi:hypothetical protein